MQLNHIAFIMDGNGRWAKQRGLPRTAGHTAGAKTFRNLLKHLADTEVKFVTVYAFSTENWSRPKTETDAILKLLEQYIDEAEREADRNDLRIIFIGDRTPFSESLKKKMVRLEKQTENRSLTCNIALNYGSRSEIVHAVNEAIEQGQTPVTEEIIEQHLYTKDSPPPDLIVRTAGEKRLSNFLLWQAAYSEFYFVDKYWPDMTPEDVDEAISAFHKRDRRFGGIEKK